jgi:hypothetical protein
MSAKAGLIYCYILTGGDLTGSDEAICDKIRRRERSGRAKVFGGARVPSSSLRCRPARPGRSSRSSPRAVLSNTKHLILLENGVDIGSSPIVILTEPHDDSPKSIAGKLPSIPDLFSASSERNPSSSSVQPPPSSHRDGATAVSSSVRHVLPSDLPTAIKQLDDEEPERVHSAVVAEQQRRGKSSPTLDNRRQRNEAPKHTLTSGQVNAVRAAFKAGVTPPRIARQFGLSQADVRKALVGDKHRSA